MTKKLAVIDGKSVFYRGYYSMPGLSLPDGTPTGGVFGFTSLAIELIKKLEPDYVAVAWDKKGTNIRSRRAIYPEYKAGRKKAPEDFYAQLPMLFELLEAFGWPLYEIDDYEADDIMGAFAKQAEEKGIETYLLTSDLDALQLISPMTKVYALKNGLSNIQEFDEIAFEKKYGIKVEQFLDLKSLKGDSSDNIPGVPGIGEKTAVDLLQKYQTLEGVYEHLDEIKPSISKKLKDGKELAEISKKISRIWTEAPVKLDWKVADVNDTNLDKVEAILKKLEFHSLVKRLPKHMQQVDKGHALHVADSKIEKVNLVAWPENLNIDDPVILHVDNDEIWVSLSNHTVSKKLIKDVDKSEWKAFELSRIVALDVKNLYHQLDQHGIDVHFDDVHDVNQAAFLIDPLRRDRSLAGLIGQEMSDMIDTITAIRKIYLWQIEAFNHMPKVGGIARMLDFPLTYNLFEMEKKGIKIDVDMLKKMSLNLEEEYKELEQKMYTLAGKEFNIASPSQLSEVLFEVLDLPTAGIKKGKTGYSTGQKELDKLRGKHPIIELIEKTRELAKLKNTYIDTLPAQADDNSRVHTSFNQDVAATGRLSSTNPNLQNIPTRTELGRKIRDAFIAEKGFVLINADYSQFELRLAAVMSGDKSMIEDFNRGDDIHTKTASEIYGVPMDNVTKNQRRNAKVINFGVLYGMSPHGLSVATGMTMQEAKVFIDKYFALRAPLRGYIEGILSDARNSGFVETYFGRRRPTPDIHSSNFIVRQAAERAAANMPLQGTEADLMKLAMIRIDQKITGLGKQILQVHDSILVEAPKEHANKVAEIMKTTMESIAPDLGIKLDVDISIGANWGELS
jgi:DNA polymerase-1